MQHTDHKRYSWQTGRATVGDSRATVGRPSVIVGRPTSLPPRRLQTNGRPTGWWWSVDGRPTGRPTGRLVACPQDCPASIYNYCIFTNRIGFYFFLFLNVNW